MNVLLVSGHSCLNRNENKNSPFSIINRGISIKTQQVTIIGAGLAGCEAALLLADLGVTVTLFDAKPTTMSPAHSLGSFCELVCSNSLKSLDKYTAHGLLKEELFMLDCKLLQIAKSVQVGAGSALAVDRELFAGVVTDKIKSHKNITIKSQIVNQIDTNGFTILATGPLTLGKIPQFLSQEFGQNLYFFDAAAPIISSDSIDFNSAFIADRYNKGDGDYINCPLEKDEYYAFIEALNNAEKAPLKEFEKEELSIDGKSPKVSIFEGCMPVEIMASRGKDTLRFGPLKPVGIVDPKSDKRPFAVVQLRKENYNGTMYNMVGFQTNLKFLEQKRVFGLIPALKNAEFLRYGVMHRNTFINAPEILNADFSTIKNPNLYIAGQLSGVEGYVESIASGLISALSVANKLQNKQPLAFSPNTMLGSLTRYLTTPNTNFQPMNANFGLLPPIDVKDKKQRKIAQVDRALQETTK